MPALIATRRAIERKPENVYLRIFLARRIVARKNVEHSAAIVFVRAFRRHAARYVVALMPSLRTELTDIF